MLQALRCLNRWIAIAIGMVLLGCAGIVVLDIIMRQMGQSLGGTDEISGYVMAIATSWGMGYTLLELGHVRIDLLRGRVAARGRALFDLFAMLTLAGTVTLIAYWSWPVLARSLANGSKANTPLETPLAWVQIPWFAGWVYFALVAWLTFIAAALLISSKDFAKARTVIGIEGEEHSTT